MSEVNDQGSSFTCTAKVSGIAALNTGLWIL